MSITLQYCQHNVHRLWLVGNGFEKLYKVVHDACDLVYPLTSTLPPIANYDRYYYNLESPGSGFTLFDTDTYPPDGYSGIFLCLHDLTPGPFGNFGFGTGKSNEREFSLHGGRIVYDPDHGQFNVSETRSPRLRKSAFEETWSLAAVHHFVNGLPTLRFSFSFSTNDISGERGSGALGLLRSLRLVPVTLERIHQLPAYRRLAVTHPGVDDNDDRFFDQERDEETGRWRGVIWRRTRISWLNSERRKFYLE